MYKGESIMQCKKCSTELVNGKCPKCEMSDKSSQNLVFLEEDEQHVGSLSRGYISNIVLDGDFSKNYVILSDRRVYYSGIFFGSVGGAKLGKMRSQLILPLEKITSIGIMNKSNVGILILGVLLLIAGIIGAASFSQNVRRAGSGPILFLLPSIILFLVYWFSKRKYFVISTDSGSMDIDFRIFGMNAIVEFSKKLGAALTKHRSNWVGGRGTSAS